MEKKETMPEAQVSPPQWRHLWSWFILLGVGSTWGSSYFFIKRALVSFDPYQIGSMRIAMTFLCFIPFALPRIRQVKRRHIWPLLVVGICGSTLPAFLFPYAQTQLSSSFTGVLSSTTPIFTLALGALFFKLVLSGQKILGVVIGFGGALMLIMLSGQGELQGDPKYAMMACLATAFYATSSNTINTYLTELGTITISSIAFMMIGIPAILYLVITDVGEVFRNDPQAWTSFRYLLILSIAGTAMATIFYFKLIKMSGVIFASTISYIIPCFAVIVGFLDGETLTWVHAAGMGLILIGIFLTSKR